MEDKYEIITDVYKTISHYKNCKLHRDNDLPAVEYINGSKYWYKEGKCHRLDGPAEIYNNGSKVWFYEGMRHRDNGPAIETIGRKEWFIEGKRHRLDGPAVEYKNGDKEWYYEDKWIRCNSQEEFERIINLQLFW